MLNRTRTRIAWTAFFLGLFLVPGLASAQELLKAQQKCVNTTNKNAQKIGDAQGKDIAACVKDFAKGKKPSAEDCAVSDPNGKVGKAESGYDSKTGSDCGAGSGFMNLADGAFAKDVAKNKELDILHTIFSVGDVDPLIILEADPNDPDSKTNSKCQQAIIKAVYKCQTAKWKAYNSCKKNKLKGKGTTPATTALELQDECLGANGTASGVPDPKGKIAQKCDFAGTISKKCPNQDLFPGCPGVHPNLNACLDAIVECAFCRAINSIDGLDRDCDEFDNGVADGSCATSVCRLSEDQFCVGGTKDGATCTDTLEHSDCPPGPPDARCLRDSHFLIETAPGGVQSTLFTIAFGGDLTFDCDSPDPITGEAACTCDLENPKNFEIPGIGFICLSTFSGCDPVGAIDCDGGKPLDLDAIGSHDIGPEVLILDPNQFFIPFCGLLDPSCLVGQADPNCNAHDECAAMCDVYCADQAGSFTRFDSGCEGFCEFGARNNLPCTLDADCPDGLCVGPDPATAHINNCNCYCLEVAGAPSPPGAVHCTLGTAVALESKEPCDGLDITAEIGAQCTPITTQVSTAVLLKANDFLADSIVGPPRSGSPIDCADFFSGNLTGMTISGNQTFFDSDVGDIITPQTYACE